MTYYSSLWQRESRKFRITVFRKKRTWNIKDFKNQDMFKQLKNVFRVLKLIF